MRKLLSVSIVVLAGLAAGCRTTHSVNVFPTDVFTAEDDDCTRRASGVTLAGHQVPVYEYYQEPIYKTQKTPIYGQETVPVFRTRKRPITIPVKDWCTGCETERCLWTVSDKVQVGVKRVDTCIGYKEERVVVGHCRKRRLVGWRTIEPAPCPQPAPACP